jgi:hypothetical protein
MMPRLGEKYDIEIEIISKPREAFKSNEYLKLNLPVAPAIMVGEEILVERSDISEKKLESVICKYLGLSPPEQRKKGIFDRIWNRSSSLIG